MHSPIDRIPPVIRKIILRYLSERLEASVISTAAALQEIRKEMPETPRVTDKELANYIAETAVEAGFDVDSDWEGTIH